MEILTRLSTGYSLLGQPENDLHLDDAASEHASALEEAGYRPGPGVLHVSGLEPIQALRGITDGPTMVAEGAVVGPYIVHGQAMRGFTLYHPPADDTHSAANILSRCVRISSKDDPASSEPYQIRANVETRRVDPIPILEPRLISPARNANTPTEQIWSVLTNSYIRRGSLQSLETYQEQMQSVIAFAIEREEPLQLVLPTLPFKDQNPATTGQPVEAVDLGEHALVAQLRDLLQSVQTVYEPGLQVVLVSDGQVYREIFTSATKEQITAYVQNASQLIERYGLSDSVRIVDFADIIAHDEDFRAHERGVERVLFYQRSRRLVECLRALQRGMLTNCQFDEYSMVNIERYRNADISDWPGDIRRHTAQAARRYAAFLITACQRHSLEQEFPDALRATVHPKDAPQLPLHLVNNRSVVFPYNGVPILRDDDPGLRRSLRILRLSQLLATEGDFYQCQDDGGNTLYYQRRVS